MLAPLPRIVVVLGKGGVGRSTVSAALGSALCDRGERVVIVEWTIAEAIAPWFDHAPVDVDPREIAPRLSVMNYRLEAVLRTYFVDHLKLGLFYRHIVDGPHLRALIEAAPGFAELMFVGHLWWLTGLAEEEAGYAFDRVIVDAPATGHGASLLDLPATLASLGATGLLGMEIGRVTAMLADPARTGAIVVALPEELAKDETLELVPRVTRALGRRPIAAIVNRCVAPIAGTFARPPWVDALAARLSPVAREGLEVLQSDLRGRAARADELVRALAGATEAGTFLLDEQLALAGEASPRDVVRALAAELGALLDRGALAGSAAAPAAAPGGRATSRSAGGAS